MLSFWQKITQFDGHGIVTELMFTRQNQMGPAYQRSIVQRALNPEFMMTTMTLKDKETTFALSYRSIIASSQNKLRYASVCDNCHLPFCTLSSELPRISVYGGLRYNGDLAIVTLALVNADSPRTSRLAGVCRSRRHQSQN